MLQLLLLAQGVYSKAQCTEVSSKKHKRLDTAPFRNITAASLVDCGDVCEEVSECQSINYLHTTQRCELLKISHHYSGGSLLKPVPEWGYLVMAMHPCNQQKVYPCENAGRCKRRSPKSTMTKCICDKPYGGEDCSEKGKMSIDKKIKTYQGVYKTKPDFKP